MSDSQAAQTKKHWREEHMEMAMVEYEAGMKMREATRILKVFRMTLANQVSGLVTHGMLQWAKATACNRG